MYSYILYRIVKAVFYSSLARILSLLKAIITSSTVKTLALDILLSVSRIYRIGYLFLTVIAFTTR